MRALPICAISLSFAVALGSFACSGSEPNAVTYGTGAMPGTSGSSPGTAGSSTDPGAGSGPVSTGGTGSGGSGVLPGGGSGTAEAGSSTGGSSSDNGGSSSAAGTASGGSGTGGTGSMATGHFKMLVYYETRGYAHQSAIKEGGDMLKAMATQNDFEVVMSDGEQTGVMNDPQITAADLAAFDMVFFLNPTGDIFGSTGERDIFKTWLKGKKSFAGVHSTTDTEHSYPWYEDLVGEIYSGHTSANLPSGTVNIEDAMKNHPTMMGLPSPWTRNEEWYNFTKGRVNGNLPGMQVLLRFGGPTPANGPAVGQPIAWIRCWEGIRSFYTAMGHDGSAYKEADFKKHVLQGILWAARRTSATNETCP